MAHGGVTNEPVAGAMHMMAEAIERANSRVAVPPPPVFDGSDPMYTIEDLFKLFEPYATAVYGRTSRSWLLALPTFVGGEVKEALTAIGPLHATYEEVKQQLKHAYATKPGNLGSPHAQFIRAERRPSESLQVFRFRLQRLANEAFPADQNKDKLLVSKFLMNLTPDVRNSVEAHLLNHRDTDLNFVVDLAATLERNHQSLMGDFNYVAMAGLQKEKCEWCRKEGHTHVTCPIRNKNCFRCGEKGHFMRDCSQRRNNTYRPANSQSQRTEERSSIQQERRCVFCEEV